MPRLQSIIITTLWLVWTLGIAVAFFQVRAVQRQAAQELILLKARTLFEQVVLTRSWNARHGGVYVFTSKDTPPNPYLEHPERDITLPDGRMLTMINPAYMTRQIDELGLAVNATHRMHITSLTPIRPGNAPDAWEETALQRFEHGMGEFWEILPSPLAEQEAAKSSRRRDDWDDADVFRYMAPLKVDRSCMRCHARQGYEVGEIRGGVSVSIPMEGATAAMKKTSASVGGWFLLLWGAGGVGFVISLYCLAQSRRNVLQAMRAKSNFLATMSDELHSPINGILGLTELALADGMSAQQREYLQGSQEYARKLHRLFTFILEYASLDVHEELAGNAHPFALREVVETLTHEFQPRARAKGLRLLMRVDPDLPPVLVGDLHLLNLAVSQLLDNAIKFTDTGEVQAHFRRCVHQSGWRRLWGVALKKACVLECVVSDTGPGMEPALQKEAFAPFHQGDASLSRKHGGVGLGLSLARRLAQVMGGDVVLESTPGIGTTVWFRARFALPDKEGGRPGEM